MSLILVTGMPGVGKTTIMRKLSVELAKQNISVAGFYTEEVRDGKTGDRTGFDVVTFDGQRAALARTTTAGNSSTSRNPTVGRYSVCLEEFERLAIPALDRRSADILLLDEIGRMELKSRRFHERMDAIIKEVETGRIRFVATVPLKSAGIDVIERLKRITNCQLFHVKPSNRDEMYGDVKDAALCLIRG
ncbi:nucleoside-triphosphatase THEP1 [Anopheles maculipalpis]|uniref:nucleoside-triphosphatase THEP1 n=1 Tax=Anopheles maculipalpis TaxID=1496333 RepID=UPI00215991EE|nr:nucleoside-triphosphatase THEP1 [Anopheles maculipalpis]